MTAGASDDIPRGPSMSLPPWYRTQMCDQSEPLVPKIEPSIHHDHLEPGLGQKVTQALERQSALCDRINLLRKIVGHYMRKEGLTQAKWDFAELLKADAVIIESDGRGGYTGRIES